VRLESSFCRNLRNGQFAASKKVDAELALHPTDRAIVYLVFTHGNNIITFHVRRSQCAMDVKTKKTNISRLDVKAILIGSVFIYRVSKSANRSNKSY